MKKALRISGFVFLALLVLGLAGFAIWASSPAGPQPEALQSLNDSAEVNFETTHGWLVYTPTKTTPSSSLILYPGARVDPRAYAPHAQAIAAGGFKVVIVPMPLNFAFLGANRASQVMAAFPDIDLWSVGGHSLGGAMAAEFAHNHSQEIDGLVLWASFPAENTDLSALDIKAISIYATNDGLASPEEVLSAQPRLPADAQFIAIPGGNHAGFGWYGPQAGDGELEIEKSERSPKLWQPPLGFYPRWKKNK